MRQEPQYITVNRRAYDELASEYRERAGADRIRDAKIIAPMATYLKERFGEGARILDIGPGNGVNLAMFQELGFRVSGIDLSSRMIEVAREFCPTADLRLGNFLTSPYSPASFEGVFSKASIHLFPKKDAVLVLRKVADILVDNGMLYVTTTVSHAPNEAYSEKRDYLSSAVRYRKSWTPMELLKAIADAGLTVYAQGHNTEEDRCKHWFNVWATKTTSSTEK